MRRRVFGPVIAFLIIASSFSAWQLQRVLQENAFHHDFHSEDDIHMDTYHDHDDIHSKAISYKLVKGPRRDYNTSFVIVYGTDENGNDIVTDQIIHSYRCNADDDGDEGPERVSMPILEQEGVTDFHTTVDTKLNIVYIGDSVADQYMKSMMYASQPTHYQVIRTSSNHMQIAQVAKGAAGGIIAGLRVTGLMRRHWLSRNRRQKMSPFGGGGWLESDITELRRYVNQWHSFQPMYDQYGFVRDIKERAYPCASAAAAANDTNGNHTLELESPAGQVYEHAHVPKEPIGGTINATCSCQEKDYDVAVYQFAPGWLSAPLHDKITDATIDEAVDIVFQYFGVHTLILQTAHINNNMFSVEELVISNQRIWDYARRFRAREYERWTTATRMQMQTQQQPQPQRMNATKVNSTMNSNATSTTTIPPMRKIIVMDVGAFSTAIVLHNALHIGAMTKDQDSDSSVAVAVADLFKMHARAMETLTFHHGNAAFNNATMTALRGLMTQKLKRRRGKDKFSVIMPHLCGMYMNETLRNETTDCEVKSSHSADGMHWCLNKVGSRFDAVVACLIQCSDSYDHADADIDADADGTGNNYNYYNSDFALCEKRCNAQFMTLTPIDWNNATELSF